MGHTHLADSLAEAAGELFETRGLNCAEAIITALNQGLGGGLDPDHARNLAAGFGEGLGGSGCLCGALGGAVLAVSWFVGAALSKKDVLAAVGEVHRGFKTESGSTCCRVLTKPVRHDTSRHKAHCAGLTRRGARLAAAVILSRRPELAAAAAAIANGATPQAQRRKPSRLAGLLHRLADKIAGH